MIGTDLISIVSEISNEKAREYAIGKWILKSKLTTEEWADKLGVQISTIYDYNFEYKHIRAKISERMTSHIEGEWEDIYKGVTEFYSKKVKDKDESVMKELLPYIRARKEQIEVGGSLEVTQPIAISIKRMKEDAGGN